MKSLKPRLLTAAIGIPAVVLIIFLSELWRPTLNLVVSGVTAVMIGEYLNGKGMLKNYPISVVCIFSSDAVVRDRICLPDTGCLYAGGVHGADYPSQKIQLY